MAISCLPFLYQESMITEVESDSKSDLYNMVVKMSPSWFLTFHFIETEKTFLT